MTDKINKEVAKFTAKEKEIVKELVPKILQANWSEVKRQKVKNSDDVYKIRKGRIRIVFQVKDKDVILLRIQRRSEKTYKL